MNINNNIIPVYSRTNSVPEQNDFLELCPFEHANTDTTSQDLEIHRDKDVEKLARGPSVYVDGGLERLWTTKEVSAHTRVSLSFRLAPLLLLIMLYIYGLQQVSSNETMQPIFSTYQAYVIGDVLHSIQPKFSGSFFAVEIIVYILILLTAIRLIFVKNNLFILNKSLLLLTVSLAFSTLSSLLNIILSPQECMFRTPRNSFDWFTFPFLHAFEYSCSNYYPPFGSSVTYFIATLAYMWTFELKSTIWREHVVRTLVLICLAMCLVFTFLSGHSYSFQVFSAVFNFCFTIRLVNFIFGL
jgi:hypothetical protein